MARRSITEVTAGAAVLVVAAGFLAYAVANTGRSEHGGYTLHAAFDRVDGLDVGSNVRLAGVTVGSVTSMRVDPKTYLADVSFTVADAIRLPKDTSASVNSESLLGGKYLGLVPGGDTEMIPPGGEITVTQPSVSLEDLLGKFIFNVTDLVNAIKTQNGTGGSPGGNAGSQGGGGALAPLK